MRVAVVGGGVAGLGAAYVLARAHEVEVFEREERPGGHVNTVYVDGLALDTGFLVHNERNYPLLGRLFRELGIRTQESDMTFSVSCLDCGLEYAGRRPFAQARNAASAHFHGLLWEIGRWLRTARRSLDEQDLDGWSLGRYLDEHGYSQRFRRHFLVPLTSALWSAEPARALELPAGYAIRFFDNHGMLGFRRFRWRSVVGGGAGRTSTRSPSDWAGFEPASRCAVSGGGRTAFWCGRPTARRTDSIAWWSPPTPTRRSHCSRIRPTRSDGCSERSRTQPTMPSSTRTRRSCPARRPPGRPGTTG